MGGLTPGYVHEQAYKAVCHENNKLRKINEQMKAELTRYACFVAQAITTLGFKPLRSKDVALMVSLLKASGMPEDEVHLAWRATKEAVKAQEEADKPQP